MKNRRSGAARVKAAPARLLTIGYERAELDDFILTLRGAGVAMLLDVRQLPISRRRGFAKTALSEALQIAGIDYIHLRGLGNPKEGRDAARAGDRVSFHRIFTRHMRTHQARGELDRAAELVSSGLACLMCYEREANECHRSIVAEALSQRLPLSVEHLAVREGVAKNAGKIGTGAGARPREGSTARR
jgi:uncharacterized protein (DUF488 family)